MPTFADRWVSRGQRDVLHFSHLNNIIDNNDNENKFYQKLFEESVII
jgi:hypothetical protein